MLLHFSLCMAVSFLGLLSSGMDPEVGIWNLALSSQAGTLGSRIPLRLLSLALVTAEHLGSPKTKTNININMQESIMLC